jgi:hypothetical protein
LDTEPDEVGADEVGAALVGASGRVPVSETTRTHPAKRISELAIHFNMSLISTVCRKTIPSSHSLIFSHLQEWKELETD